MRPINNAKLRELYKEQGLKIWLMPINLIKTEGFCTGPINFKDCSNTYLQ